MCVGGSVPSGDHPRRSPLQTPTKVIVGEDTHPALTPGVTGGLYDGDSQRKSDNRIRLYVVCYVCVCVCVPGLYTCMTPPIQRVCTHRALHASTECLDSCVGVFALSVGLCVQ